MGYSTPVAYEEMKVNAAQFGMREEDVDHAIELGIYYPKDTTCHEEIVINQEESLQGSSLFGLGNKNKWLELKGILTQTYLLLGESLIVEDDDLAYNEQELNVILDAAAIGELKPLCGASARIISRVLNEEYLGYEAFELNIDQLNHIIAGLYYSEGNAEYALALDAQNGFIYPVKEDLGFYSLEELEELQDDSLAMSNLNLYWLEDSILLQKRLFLKEVLPCNFLPQELSNYSKAPLASNYNFVRKGYSFHKYLWFDRGTINIEALKSEIITQLVLNQ